MEILKIAFVYVGTVMGAAFAGGREVATFFIERPPIAIVAVITAGILFCVSASFICKSARLSGSDSLASFTQTAFSPAWSRIINVLTTAFLFVTYSSMLSAAGAMLNVLCRFHHIVGALISNVILYLIFSNSSKGVIKANVYLTPIILLAVAGVFVVVRILPLTARTSGFSGIESVLSGTIYVGYNLLTAIGVLVACASGATSTKKCVLGVTVGGAVLTLCLLMEYSVLIKYPTIYETSPLPMLSIASSFGRLWTVIYAFALYGAIITTAAGSAEGIIGGDEKRRKRNALILCLCAFPTSLISFSVMVRKIFSLFGYLGAIVLIKIAIDRVKVRKIKKNEDIM